MQPGEKEKKCRAIGNSFVHLLPLALHVRARMQTGYPSVGLGYTGKMRVPRGFGACGFSGSFYSGVKKWSRLDAGVRDGSCVTLLVSITFSPR